MGNWAQTFATFAKTVGLVFKNYCINLPHKVYATNSKSSQGNGAKTISSVRIKNGE